MVMCMLCKYTCYTWPMLSSFCWGRERVGHDRDSLRTTVLSSYKIESIDSFSVLL